MLQSLGQNQLSSQLELYAANVFGLAFRELYQVCSKPLPFLKLIEDLPNSIGTFSQPRSKYPIRKVLKISRPS
jgi:hypothetical protein